MKQTRKQYEEKKNFQRKIWLEKVFAHGRMDEKPAEMMKGALAMFESEYPKYK